MGLAHQQGKLHVRDGRADEHAPVGFLCQVGEDQVLIVPIQHIQGANRVNDQPGALGQGLQEDVAFGIVAQGLEMAHALHGVFDGFLVKNPPVVQGDFQTEALPDQAAEDLQLHPTHDLHMDLPILPQQVELGVFLLQLPQLGQGLGRIAELGQVHPVGHHRLQHGLGPLGLRPQGLAHVGGGKAGDCRQLSGGHLLRGGEFVPGIQPQLHQLFFQCLAFLIAVAKILAHLQAAAGDLHPGQPGSPGVPGDFVHPGGKGASVFPPGGAGIQQGEQPLHACELQRRAEAAGEELPGGDQLPQISLRHGALGQIAFQQGLVAHGRRLGDFPRLHAEIHAARAQLGLQLLQQLLPVRPGQVHFVDEKKHRHLVALQQPPEGQRVGLDPVGAADHQHGAVQHRHGALRLRREVHMPRGVHQNELPVGGFQPGLLGENGDSPLPL